MSMGSTLGFPDRRAPRETPKRQPVPYTRPAIGTPLTPRESDCCQLMEQAYTQKEIATLLDISIGTTKVLCCRVLAKKGAKEHGELVRRHIQRIKAGVTSGHEA